MWEATSLLLALATPPTEPGLPPGSLDRYFPFRLGDSWTYEWKTEGRNQALAQLSRTRVFDGTEFIGAGLAYRLVSDDGTYHLYTLDRSVLSIHSSSEGGRLYFYEPAIVLAAPDFEPGESRVVEHPDTGRRWTTTLVGFEDVTVPLGTFPKCLKIRLQMESPEYVADSYHSFAPGVGLVAYRYRLEHASTRQLEIQIDARLRLAHLSGTSITRIADVARLEGGDTVRISGRDDPEARDALRAAYGRRYTWDRNFPGFRGEFVYLEEGKPEARGSYLVERDLSVKVQSASEAVRAVVRGEISSFISNRKENPFDLVYAETRFKKGSGAGPGGLEILAEGDAMATRHTVRGEDLVRVERSVGRLRYVAENLKSLATGDGRSIVVEYDLSFFSNEDGSRVSAEHVLDSYLRLGDYWLPAGRKTVKSKAGQPSGAFELRLTHAKP